MRKKICVVTGSRADYGLLYYLMRDIQKDPAFELQIIVTGAHLAHQYGLTYQKLIENGFSIDQKVEMLLASDTPNAIAKSLGLGVIGFADAFERLKPDLLLVLGDRYEIFASVQAALIYDIAIAHIHGGELTENAYDDAIRHSITKMANLHFASTEVYKKRIIQLGESPDFVFNVGAMVVDSIHNTKLFNRKELEELLEIKFDKNIFLISFYPETRSENDSIKAVDALLEALGNIKDAFLIFSKSNPDKLSEVVNDKIEKYVKMNSNRAKIFTVLGHQVYLSLVKEVDVIIGNSSSGVIEVPIMQKPSINIGDRQKGRLRLPSVINCKANSADIQAAIRVALSQEHQDVCKTFIHPFGQFGVSQRIIQEIKHFFINHSITKNFFDMVERV